MWPTESCFTPSDRHQGKKTSSPSSTAAKKDEDEKEEEEEEEKTQHIEYGDGGGKMIVRSLEDKHMQLLNRVKLSITGHYENISYKLLLNTENVGFRNFAWMNFDESCQAKQCWIITTTITPL